MILARYNEMYKGFQLQIIVVVKYKKDLKTIFGMTDYFINTWVGFSEVKELKEHYVKYVDFYILSGEMSYCKPEWRNKAIKHTTVINYIDEYRKTFKTYNETIKHYEKTKKI